MQTIIPLVLLAAAMAVAYGLVRISDVALQMRVAARNRPAQEADLIDQASAEVRCVR